jgi:hypothetical protein
MTALEHTLADASLHDLVGKSVMIRTVVPAAAYSGTLRRYDASGVVIDAESGVQVFVFRHAMVSIEPSARYIPRE